MYSTASPTVRIFSASSSEISIPNSSSRLMMSSTRSRESALRSSTNEASGFTSASSTPSCSTTIFLRRSYIFASANRLPPCHYFRYPPPASPPASGKVSPLRCSPVNRGLTSAGLTTHGGRQYTIDELRRGLRAEQLRQLDRFVDDHAGERRAGDAQLVEGDAQHVLVDLGHLLDRELGRQRRDLGIERFPVRQHALNEIPGES